MRNPLRSEESAFRLVVWTIVLGAVLVLGAALTVATVVRLALHARQDELDIMDPLDIDPGDAALILVAPLLTCALLLGKTFRIIAQQPYAGRPVPGAGYLVPSPSGQALGTPK